MERTALWTIPILRQHICGLFIPHPPTHLIRINTVLNVSKTGHFLDPPTQFFADIIHGWSLMYHHPMLKYLCARNELIAAHSSRFVWIFPKIYRANLPYKSLKSGWIVKLFNLSWVLFIYNQKIAFIYILNLALIFLDKKGTVIFRQKFTISALVQPGNRKFTEYMLLLWPAGAQWG